tara:strand:- start:109 stop:378 length:270 start_codon:yes stop_codon:yes gene_type:complete
MIKDKYKNFFLTIFSIFISILLLEVLITIFYYQDGDFRQKRYLAAKKQNLEFDKRSRVEFFNQLENIENKIIFNGAYEKKFIKKKMVKI